MNNALFQNVSERCFFPLVFIYFYCCSFLLFYFVLVFNCFFNNKNTSFFAHGYVPLVIKGKRIAVGLFKCSLAEDGTMFVLSYFYT